MLKVLVILVTLLPAVPLRGASFYTVRLDDSKAVYLTPDTFSVHGDGVADDTDAIQQAINKIQETTNRGIVFVPEGRYRLTKTIYIWPGIRVIGYGAARPVFVLAEKTPGYQDPDQENLMIYFAGGRPGAGRGSGGPGAPGPQGAGEGRRAARPREAAGARADEAAPTDSRPTPALARSTRR